MFMVNPRQSNSITPNDVARRIQAHVCNKRKSIRDIRERWIISDTFRLCQVSTSAVKPDCKDRLSVMIEEPIIVDKNKHGPGSRVLDGNHRLSTAIRLGRKTIAAYVGDALYDEIAKENYNGP